MRPPIDVPRTILVGLTNAALNSPTRPAGTTAIVVVIAMIAMVAVTVIPICGCRCAADGDCANKAKRGTHRS